MSKDIYRSTGISFFGPDGEYGCFSIDYESEFVWSEHRFRTVRQAFWWAKAVMYDEHSMAFQIEHETNPKLLDKFGLRIKDGDAWRLEKCGILEDILLAKFRQNSDITKILCDTGEVFIFYNHPIDSFWGVGPDCYGTNCLGQALMKVRASLLGSQKINENTSEKCVKPAEQKSDPVSHPSHYTDGSIEVMDYIADKGLAEGFCKGNVIKYVSRAGKKQSSDLDTNHKAIQDLEKARWYLDYLINYYKKKVEE